MKTFIKSFALALTLAAVTTSATFADGTPSARTTNAASFKTGIYSTPTGKLHVALDKQTSGKVTVRIKDAKGALLYTETIARHQMTYRSCFDLSQLGDGDYELVMTNGVETTRQSITIRTQQQRHIQTQLVAAN